MHCYSAFFEILHSQARRPIKHMQSLHVSYIPVKWGAYHCKTGERPMELAEASEQKLFYDWYLRNWSSSCFLCAEQEWEREWIFLFLLVIWKTDLMETLWRENIIKSWRGKLCKKARLRRPCLSPSCQEGWDSLLKSEQRVVRMVTGGSGNPTEMIHTGTMRANWIYATLVASWDLFLISISRV